MTECKFSKGCQEFDPQSLRVCLDDDMASKVCMSHMWYRAFGEKRRPLIVEVSNGTISLVINNLSFENLKNSLNEIFDKYDIPLCITECVTHTQFKDTLDLIDQMVKEKK